MRLSLISSLVFALIGTASAHAAAYTAKPLRPRAEPPAGGKPFTLLRSEETGVTRPNVFDDPRMWGNRFRELTLGAVETGIAVADFDDDGWLDIYAISKNGPSSLYRQVAPYRFYDIAPAAGVAIADEPTSNTGCTVVDINHDGWPDLYVCRYDQPNLLFINNGGDGTFTESAKAYGLDIKDASVHAVFADYDRDGFLDLYLVTNILDFAKSPQGRKHYLFRNTGNHRFTDVTAKAGIWGLSQGHTALWTDFNHDGWPDLYVANDFETPDRLYLNKGDGSFADVIDERLPHVTYFSMGADAGDLNNDGRVDLFITDMRDRTHGEFMTGMEEIGRGLWELERVNELIPQYMWNAVYLNTGTDRFAEAAHLTGMEATGWTWSARLADLDNDGHLDAFITAGMIRNFIDADLVDKQNVAPSLSARANVWKNSAPRRESTQAFRNRGDLRFEDVSAAWGLDRAGVSFGCAVADLDGDGDLDLVFSNYNEPPSIVRNDTTSGHRVVIKLAGSGGNPHGVGAELELQTSAGTQIRQVFTERGIVASEPALVHFGLGESRGIDRLTIRWPRGQVQVLENLPVDHLLTITEPPLSSETKPAVARFHTPPSSEALFTETAAARGLKYGNLLRPFDEFARQRLLPRRCNGLGPALASADVNGDGLGDVYVTGTAGQNGRLFLGATDGSFTVSESNPWSTALEADDVGATFFDLNGDGHPDLFLAAGGIQVDRGQPLLDDRIYLNDGRGGFTLAPEGTLPADGESTAAVAAGDFDGDQRADLFVGGRVVPGAYPALPRSFLYRNAGGRLVDVTDEVAPGLREIGMVTAALWTDVDRDGRIDLVLSTDWGPIAYFRNVGGKLENHTARVGLAGVTGWWSALTAADINGDGRIDLIAGNVGLNTKYEASAPHPATLFAGDLDGSGRQQLIEAKYVEGKLVPVRGRSKLAYSYPWLTRKFPTFQAYARASLTDIFDQEKLNAATRLEATELASGVFLQRADGRFEFVPLPRAAQLAPINSIVARDLDGDGKLDLFCVGNDFGPEPTTGRWDGGLGAFLKGDGKGNFVVLAASESGVVIPDEARSAVSVGGPDGARVVVASNQGPVRLYERRRP